ncbi:hypothetical protein DEO72_LG7g1306 [Vigna unguiculata]|uniref:Uncharacterized protein n=1 Tax=Vigna unguiculata TaxID=3917 RepID=A0A4D6MF07_VIGUN|nr:hypothetical protein DEO72_LG7g1306 [Vigna unguiculata]
MTYLAKGWDYSRWIGPIRPSSKPCPPTYSPTMYRSLVQSTCHSVASHTSSTLHVVVSFLGCRCLPSRLSWSTSAFDMSSSASPKLNLTSGLLEPLPHRPLLTVCRTTLREHIGSKPYHYGIDDSAIVLRINLTVASFGVDDQVKKYLSEGMNVNVFDGEEEVKIIKLQYSLKVNA